MGKKRITTDAGSEPSTHAPGSRRGVTLHDVARVAGYSAMTVSRALNNPDSVPKQTLERVRDAVAQVHYVPNLLAGGLRSRRSGLVAAVIPTLASTLFNEMILALTTTLNEHGYQLILGQSGYSPQSEHDLLDALIGRRPDGIVLTGVDHLPDVGRKLLAASIPVVETWDLSSAPIDMLVGFSHAAVGAAVCQHFCQRGRRRLGVIGGDDERAKRRCDAFVRAAVAAGLAPPIHIAVPAPATVASGRQGFARMFEQRPDLDGVFCNSDLSAIGVLTEAQVRGIRVPEQMGVIGFGDMAFSADLHPALTTVRINGTQIGQQAAQCIIDRARSDENGPRIIDIGFSVIERASC